MSVLPRRKKGGTGPETQALGPGRSGLELQFYHSPAVQPSIGHRAWWKLRDGGEHLARLFQMCTHSTLHSPSPPSGASDGRATL